jgi:hypothetical protein
VSARCGGHGHRRPIRSLKPNGLPRHQALRLASEALGSWPRGQDPVGSRKECSARGIEVVAVMIVTEQDGIDLAELGRQERRPSYLP